jgi:hypothetical protein
MSDCGHGSRCCRVYRAHQAKPRADVRMLSRAMRRRGVWRAEVQVNAVRGGSSVPTHPGGKLVTDPDPSAAKCPVWTEAVDGRENEKLARALIGILWGVLITE